MKYKKPKTLKKETIGIIGLGYVGLPLALEFGKKFKVIGYDSDESRILGLKKNFDSSIFVEGENEKIFDEVEEYLSVIWSSESSIEIASYSDIFE